MLYQDPSAGPDSPASANRRIVATCFRSTSGRVPTPVRNAADSKARWCRERRIRHGGYRFQDRRILPLAEFTKTAKPSARRHVPVSIKGRDPEGYYELSRMKVERPRDCRRSRRPSPIRLHRGRGDGRHQGWVSVDVGVRAFMPASRSGARKPLTGETGRAGHTLPHHQAGYGRRGRGGGPRAVLEDEERESKEQRYSQIKEGETVTGTVRSLTIRRLRRYRRGGRAAPCGRYFLGRVAKPADVLQQGQQVEAKYSRWTPPSAASRLPETTATAPVGSGRRQV